MKAELERLHQIMDTESGHADIIKLRDGIEQILTEVRRLKEILIQTDNDKILLSVIATWIEHHWEHWFVYFKNYGAVGGYFFGMGKSTQTKLDLLEEEMEMLLNINTGDKK